MSHSIFAEIQSIEKRTLDLLNEIVVNEPEHVKLSTAFKEYIPDLFDELIIWVARNYKS